MVLGQYGAVLVGTWWYWVSVTWYYWILSGIGLVQRFYACIYWKKSGDLVGCHHSRTTTKKGKIGLLSQWTMDGWDEQKAQPDILSPESLVRLNNSLPLREFEDVRTLALCKDDTNGKTWRLKVSSFQERGNGPDFHLTFWNFATLQSVVCQSVLVKPMKIFKFMFHFVIAENGAFIQHVTFFCNLLLIPAIEEFKYPEKGHQIGCF